MKLNLAVRAYPTVATVPTFHIMGSNPRRLPPTLCSIIASKTDVGVVAGGLLGRERGR